MMVSILIFKFKIAFFPWKLFQAFYRRWPNLHRNRWRRGSPISLRFPIYVRCRRVSPSRPSGSWSTWVRCPNEDLSGWDAATSTSWWRRQLHHFRPFWIKKARLFYMYEKIIGIHRKGLTFLYNSVWVLNLNVWFYNTKIFFESEIKLTFIDWVG